MSTPFDYYRFAPDAVKALQGVSAYLRQSGLEKGLLHLIDLRASQINGCAFCIDMHMDEAIAAGDSHTRLHLVSVWHETDLFSEREQVALAWTEAVTRISEGAPSAELLERALKVFTEEELVKLNLAVATINAWNRFAKTFHSRPALKSLRQGGAAHA